MNPQKNLYISGNDSITNRSIKEKVQRFGGDNPMMKKEDFPSISSADVRSVKESWQGK